MAARELAEMIAKFRTPPGFDWNPLANDIETALSSSPPEDPTPEMIGRGMKIHRTFRAGDEETLVHDIWQAMYDEWLSSQPVKEH